MVSCQSLNIHTGAGSLKKNKHWCFWVPESVVHVTVKCQGLNKKTDWRSELLSDRRRRERKPYLQVNVGLSLYIACSQMLVPPSTSTLMLCWLYLMEGLSFSQLACWSTLFNTATETRIMFQNCKSMERHLVVPTLLGLSQVAHIGRVGFYSGASKLCLDCAFLGPDNHLSRMLWLSWVLLCSLTISFVHRCSAVCYCWFSGVLVEQNCNITIVSIHINGDALLVGATLLRLCRVEHGLCRQTWNLSQASQAALV